MLTIHSCSEYDRDSNQKTSIQTVHHATMVKDIVANDEAFQKEMDLLLDLVDKDYKKLDPKKLRKMPKLMEQLSTEQLDPAVLADYIGQRYILKGTKTTSKGITCTPNKYLASHVALGVAKMIVGQEHEEDNKENEPTNGDNNNKGLAKIIDSIQAEVSQALLEFLDLTGFSIEETMSKDVCATLIDLQCRKHEAALDKLVCYGETGAFLSQCPVYQRPPKEIAILMEELMAKVKKGFSDTSLRAKLIHHTVSISALAISNDVDRVKRECWECGKVCKANLSACSCCRTANYCSASCQRKAWKGGHKGKCKSLATNFKLHQDSINLMDEIHITQEEYQHLPIKDERVDYRIFSHIFTLPAQAFQKKTMKGPSMTYFYQNMERIQTKGWWVLSVGPPLPQYHHARAHFKGDCLNEENAFLNLAHVLSYDLVGFYGPQMQMERIGNAYLQQFNELQLVALAVTSEMGFGARARHPRETGVPMPAARFLQLYQQYATEYDDLGKLWSHTKRQMCKLVLSDFRAEHHK